jgi:hypothetical protein
MFTFLYLRTHDLKTFFHVYKFVEITIREIACIKNTFPDKPLRVV